MAPPWPRSPILTDRVGPRLSGSPGAAQAVRWAVEQFQAAGVPVRTEAVTVTPWVRGEERGEVLAGPGRHAWPLALTALGGSAPTLAGGVEAEVVEVTSLEALATTPVEGRIVYFHHRMATAAGYGDASELRSFGPAKAAERGAVATMVRSAASASLRSRHTGVAVFHAGKRAIPAVALATEDADALHRWLVAPARSGCAWWSVARPARRPVGQRHRGDPRPGAPGGNRLVELTWTPGIPRWAHRTMVPGWRWCWRRRASSLGCARRRGEPSASCSS